MVAVTSMPMGQPMGQPQMNATSPMPNPMGGSAPNPMMPTNPMPNPMMGAKFKSALGTRKNKFLQSQQMQMQPQMQPRPQMQPIAPIGRTIGNNANVGSAPVQLMNGGIVPLFGGLGRY